MKKTLKKLNFSEHFSNSSYLRHKSPAINQSSLDFVLLTQKWEEIVGPTLKDHTYPKSLKNYTLTLMVRHAVFASELKSLSPILIKKIIDIYPSFKDQIKDIRFVASEVFFEHLQNTSPHKKTPPPPKNNYDPEYAQKKYEAEKIFKDFEEEELKDLFVSLYTQK